MNIRVLSYNIHKGIGGRDRRYRLQRVADVIAHEQPDVICLQEVDRHARRSRFDNQAELLAEQFHPADKLFQFVFGKPRLGARRDTSNAGTQAHVEPGYGNLILSRWPFLEHHQVSLTLRTKKPRGAQWAVINAPAGPLRIVNWHLGLAERERQWQVRRLLEHHLFRPHAHLPTLIIGDTNDWRNTLIRGPFAVHGYQLVTSPPSRFRSFPAYLPIGSLDKAFTHGPFESVHARIAHSKLARDASDHLPLVVDLALAPTVPDRSLPQGPPV